jgi:rubredoxin
MRQEQMRPADSQNLYEMRNKNFGIHGMTSESMMCISCGYRGNDTDFGKQYESEEGSVQIDIHRECPECTSNNVTIVIPHQASGDK